MYAMRIEDADHVTGNHVIGLQKIPASAAAAERAYLPSLFECKWTTIHVDNWLYFVSVCVCVWDRRDRGRDGLARRKLEWWWWWRDNGRQKEIRISQRMIRLISFRDETRETVD